jgi:hypothetical protein
MRLIGSILVVKNRGSIATFAGGERASSNRGSNGATFGLWDRRFSGEFLIAEVRSYSMVRRNPQEGAGGRKAFGYSVWAATRAGRWRV